ncbi:hypothetical protein GCM10023213_25240 [Prosthecobacter algae]|uniref:Uncharacterized protein n=1 Tax=Prosthecobacter algae TaxID=1144682 RepID=A0ABP9P631_9BACT
MPSSPERAGEEKVVRPYCLALSGLGEGDDFLLGVPGLRSLRLADPGLGCPAPLGLGEEWVEGVRSNELVIDHKKSPPAVDRVAPLLD